MVGAQIVGGEAEPEHCKGMEGLVTEAKKHGIQEAPTDGKLREDWEKLIRKLSE